MPARPADELVEVTVAATNGERNVEVARRRLRGVVRDARTRCGMTQKDVADKLGWSVSKLLRLEQGVSPVSPSDVRALMSVYGELDTARIESYVELAKQARDHASFEEFHDIASREYRELIGLESAAKVIYKYEPSVIPGLFQTEDYARHLSRAIGNEPDRVERQVRLRLLRQQRLLESGNPPELHFIIGEAALFRRVGTPELMNEQHAHLVSLDKQRGVTLDLYPLEAGPHPRMGPAFTILQFDDPDIGDALYVETPEGESLQREEADELNAYRELFIQLVTTAETFGDFPVQLERLRAARENLYRSAGGLSRPDVSSAPDRAGAAGQATGDAVR